MKITLVAYGIAKDILSCTQKEYVAVDNADIRTLKEALVKEYPAFDQLAHLRFAVNESYQDDQYPLKENDEVVIIPPVSGG